MVDVSPWVCGGLEVGAGGFPLVALNREGIVSELVEVLIDRGFTRRELDWIVPARTLAYRHRALDTTMSPSVRISGFPP